MPASEAVSDTIRKILKDHGRLDLDVTSLTPDADLYDAGMTSHASVNVMLAIESAFDIEFPDQMLSRGVFESIQSISTAVSSLQQR
jgi:acyl carrier protein